MYEPSRLIDSFYIKGFKNFDGASALKKLKVGKKLDLIPEPDNPYDPCAMRVERKGVKLGYIPKEKNYMMSLMSFYGHADVFECRILQVDRKADPWNQVRIGIFINDARKRDVSCA
ncbi:MAG: HIRAN domain-containing protein [Eggerthellaceae bacterium]|nr:HIRAN domain-containing protein [Eggerthellaceae bacterium]